MAHLSQPTLPKTITRKVFVAMPTAVLS